MNEELCQLVEDHCTVEQISNLLRQAQSAAKKKSHVRVTADSKSELIRTNLSDAVSSERIDILAVYDLVRKAEENGNQHLFYFRPRAPSEIQALITRAAVGTALLGADWETSGVVPNANVPDEAFAIADLRGIPGKPNDWLLKLYGRFTIERHGDIREFEGDRYIKIVPEVRRHVLIARWNHPNLLELRVGREESRKRLVTKYEALWASLTPAFDRAAFADWDLGGAKGKLLELEQEYGTLYSTRDTKLHNTESDRRCSFEGHLDDNLLDDEVTRNAIIALINAGHRSTHLSLRWLKREGNAVPSAELHTLLGDRRVNEIVIAGQCEAADVDYVTEQLRRFSQISEAAAAG